MNMSVNEHHHYHDSSLTGSRSGQILWIRGLTRLQTQVRPCPLLAISLALDLTLVKLLFFRKSKG